MKPQKLTNMKTFFDYDYIECVQLFIAKENFPHLNWEKIEKRFVYTMGSEDEVEVMTLADLNLCIRLFDEKLEIEDIPYHEVAHCSVCRKVLLPDDDAYTDEKTGDTLCDEHSVFNEATDNYKKAIF